MKDVRQLVGDHHRAPVVGEAQRRALHGRIGIDDDAVGREWCRRAIGVIGVVGNDDVDRPPWWMQLRRELRIRPLRIHRNAPRRRLGGAGEVDVEVRGVDGVVPLVRRDLGAERSGECHPEERSDEGSARWRVQKLI